MALALHKSFWYLFDDIKVSRLGKSIDSWEERLLNIYTPYVLFYEKTR